MLKVLTMQGHTHTHTHTKSVNAHITEKIKSSYILNISGDRGEKEQSEAEGKTIYYYYWKGGKKGPEQREIKCVNQTQKQQLPPYTLIIKEISSFFALVPLFMLNGDTPCSLVMIPGCACSRKFSKMVRHLQQQTHTRFFFKFP